MANATAMLAVQATVYATVNVAAVTNVFGGAPVVPVFDAVPKGQAFPYVEVGEFEEHLDNTFTKNGRIVFVTLHIYSDSAGYKQVEQILEQLNILLDDTLLPDPPGWHTVSNAYELGSGQKEFDAKEIRHALARYRIQVQQP